MKNVIEFYYNLLPDNIFKNKNECYFFVDNNRFSFIKFLGDIDEIDKIYSEHLNMLNNNIYVHPIILNIYGKAFTMVDGIPFILMQTMYYENKITLNSLISFVKTYTKEKDIDWGNLWSNKNDYLEYQLSEIGLTHPIIRDSFEYYLSLGECAIAIANSVESQSIPCVYSHKRISKKDTSFDLYNPLNITIDYRVRDAAEYFKQSFFDGEEIEKELYDFFNNINLSIYEYILFLARMIYPTYYFDLIENIFLGKDNDECLIKIIEKANAYEKLIKKIYQFYKGFIDIFRIDWLEL